MKEKQSLSLSRDVSLHVELLVILLDIFQVMPSCFTVNFDWTNICLHQAFVNVPSFLSWAYLRQCLFAQPQDKGLECYPSGVLSQICIQCRMLLW